MIAETSTFVNISTPTASSDGAATHFHDVAFLPNTDAITEQLFAKLHSGGDRYFYQVYKPDGTKRSYWRKNNKPASIVPQWRTGANVYFGVNPTNVSVTDRDRKKFDGKPDKYIEQFVASKNDTVVAANCLFAEFDGKDETFPTDEEIAVEIAGVTADKQRMIDSGEIKMIPMAKAIHNEAVGRAKKTKYATDPAGYNQLALDRLESAPIAANVVWCSGGGWQAVWLFDKTFVIDGPESRELIQWVQGEWVTLVGGDPGAKDLRRILRVAGTQNVKSVYAPNFPTVQYLRADFDTLHSLDEFIALLPEKPVAPPTPAKTAAHRTNGTGGNYSKSSVINAFNAAVKIGDILDEYGYTGAGTERCRPGEPKSNSINIDEADNYSFHWSSNDPLYDPTAEGTPHKTPPFTVLLKLECNNNMSLAVRTAAEVVGMGYSSSGNLPGNPAGAVGNQTTLLQPGAVATWRNDDHDEPVEITGLLGEQDGVQYYSIKGSSTGIPVNQIVTDDVIPALPLDDLTGAIVATVQATKADVLAADDKATTSSIATATRDALTLWAIDNMSDIAKLSIADVARLKVTLKSRGLTQTWLDRDLAKLIVAEKTTQHRTAQSADTEPRYKISGGRICYKYEKQIQQGEDVITVVEYAPLCNFHASIIADVVLDDGEELAQHLAIAGELDTGEPLPEIIIPAKEFEPMQWPVANWGARPAIEPGKGKKDMLRHAIQTLSMDSIEKRHAYTHTGWREIDGERVFLHAGGAIGMDGVTVSLPRQMSSYTFPDDGAVDCAAAMRESIKLMDVAPDSISVPMWAITYAAILTEIIPANFVVDVQGGTGSLKSSYAAVYLNHFGAGFTEYKMPADWLATANSLEKQTFHAKDVLTFIDDLRPTTNIKEANQQAEAVGRITRAVGNRQGRGRLDSNSDFRRSFMPRGAVAMTSEKKSPGKSANSRMMTINVEPGQIDTDKLTVAQKQRNVYAYAMRGFIEYVAANWNELNKILPERVADTRALSNGNGQHKRLPHATAVLYTAFECAMNYATEIGAIAEVEAHSRLDDCYLVLGAMAESQNEATEAEDPALKYLTIVATLIAQDKAYLAGPVDKTTKSRDNIGFDNSEKLGWHDGRNAYLLPGAYNAVCRYATTEGWAFPSDEVTLRKELARGDWLSKTDDNRLTTKQREPGGKSTNVIAVSLAKLDLFLSGMGVDTSSRAALGVYQP